MPAASRPRLQPYLSRPIVWTLLGSLALALTSSTELQAQFAADRWSPGPVGGVPIVLAEHGSEILPVPFAVSVAGLAVFDIATAASSAHSYNQRAGGGVKSGRIAFTSSLASTTVPVVLGYAVAVDGSEEFAGVLIASGMVLGPSVGHWYAGKAGRGLLTAALRAGLGLVAALTAYAAS